MTARALVATLLLLASVSACSSVRLREHSADTTSSSGETGRPVACLALSGGGLRSGAVSLGAIQALYAGHALSRFEWVSAVSGGGYPVYGLLDRMIRDKIALRDLMREHGRYIKDVEGNAAFITPSDMYAQLALAPLGLPLIWLGSPYGSLQAPYILRIHRSFVGVSMPFLGAPELSRAQDIRKIQGFPTPLFGASASPGIAQPRDDYPYTYAQFFELSPLVSGAPAVGYFPSLAGRLSLAQAVATSAAAIDTPQKDAQLPAIAKALNFGSGSRFSTPAIDGQALQFYLADGGFIENLGLLPLLRHGCTDVLVFDNTDDLTVPFESWRNFSARLQKDEEPGWRVSAGHDLRSVNGDPLPTKTQDRWNLPHHIWEAQLENADRRVHVRLVKLGIDRHAFADYPQAVREFIESSTTRDPQCSGDGMARRCSFPLEASTRQSFSQEEFHAYRLLGKRLAKLALDAGK